MLILCDVREFLEAGCFLCKSVQANRRALSPTHPWSLYHLMKYSQSMRSCAVRLSSSICMRFSPYVPSRHVAIVSLRLEFIPVPPLNMLAGFFLHSLG